MAMKILLITDHHDPKGGGAEAYFFKLKDRLKNEPGYTVTSLGFGPQEEQGNDFFILKETPYKALRQLWRMILHPQYYFKLRHLIKKINPDIIHLHNVKKYTPALLQAIRGYPTLQTVHDFSPICPTQWNIHQDGTPCPTGFSFSCFWQHKRHYHPIAYLALLFSFYKMRRLLKKRVHRFIAPSASLKTYLNKQHFHPTEVIPPFLTREINSTPIDQLGHFLFIGQLEKQKGIDLLIDEFALAYQKNNKIKLTIAGIGSLESSLKEKITNLNLAHAIDFLGWTSNLAPHYQNCTALIFPSIGLESFGMVIQEALHAGRCVIGSRRGPTQELITHGKTGLLFDPLQKGALANCLIQLSTIPELAEHYGHNALEASMHFKDNETLFAHIKQCYLQIKKGA